MKTSIGPHIGQLAPEIDLPDERGIRWRLSDLIGKIVVILFYPADETQVCTQQLCAVRDHWEQYRAAGAVVVGINRQSVENHQRFASRHSLPLRLLSDAEGAVVRSYEMNSLMWVKRGVVVVDKEGVIRFRRVVMPFLRPSDEEVLDAIKKC